MYENFNIKCNDCIHRNVCRYKEQHGYDIARLETIRIKECKNGGIIYFDIHCKYFENEAIEKDSILYRNIPYKAFNENIGGE